MTKQSQDKLFKCKDYIRNTVIFIITIKLSKYKIYFCYFKMVSDVDIVAVLLALCDPVTEVTPSDTIINATLTQDDLGVIIMTSSHPGHNSPPGT